MDACAFSSIISISSPSTFSAVVSVLLAAFRVKSYRKLCRLWNEFRKARVNGFGCLVGSFFIAAAEHVIYWSFVIISFLCRRRCLIYHCKDWMLMTVVVYKIFSIYFLVSFECTVYCRDYLPFILIFFAIYPPRPNIKILYFNFNYVDRQWFGVVLCCYLVGISGNGYWCYAVTSNLEEDFPAANYLSGSIIVTLNLIVTFKQRVITYICNLDLSLHTNGTLCDKMLHVQIYISKTLLYSRFKPQMVLVVDNTWAPKSMQIPIFCDFIDVDETNQFAYSLTTSSKLESSSNLFELDVRY